MAVRNQLESIIGSIVVLGVATGITYVLISLRKPPEPPSRDHSAPVVLTAPVESYTGGFEIEVDGLVVPHRDITLAAEVAGRVVEKNEAVCCAGRFVEAGTLLARIDDRDFALSVKRLEQQKQQAAASLAELADESTGTYALIELAKQDVQVQQSELERLRKLGRNVSVQELETAKSKWIAARRVLTDLQNQQRMLETRRTRLQAAIDLVETQLEQARLDLQRTRIVAPVSGMIVKDQFEVDDFVQRGQELVTIEDTSKVEVKCKLELRDLFWIWGREGAEAATSDARLFQLPNQRDVTVTYEIPGWTHRRYDWSGRLDRFDGFGLDPTTRTVPCRVVVDEPRRRAADGPPTLIPGMYVTVRVPVDPGVRLLRIPRIALRPGNVVWRVRDSKLDLVPVDLVRTIGSDAARRGNKETGTRETAIIRVASDDELRHGDQLVVSPLEFVRSGMTVRAAPASSDHPAGVAVSSGFEGATSR